MRKLGDRAGGGHESLGEAVAEAKPQVVFWKGGHKEAVRAGLNKRKYAGDFYPVGGGQDFSLLLEELRLASGLALFKGSRGNQLERLVDIFRDAVISAGECHAV